MSKKEVMSRVKELMFYTPNRYVLITLPQRVKMFSNNVADNFQELMGKKCYVKSMNVSEYQACKLFKSANNLTMKNPRGFAYPSLDTQ